MKVLWLGHNLAYPPKGGSLQRNYNLLRQIAKKCEVHVLAFDQPATRPFDVQPQDCVRALHDFCASVDWVSFRRDGSVGRYLLALGGFVSRNPFEMQWLKSVQMTAKLQNLLQRMAFDVIHFDTLGLAQYEPLVRQSATVLNHHDVQSSLIARRAKNDPNMLLRQYWRREANKLRQSEKTWCPHFGMSLVCSKEEEMLLGSADSRIRTRVVPNGVDPQYFTPRPDPGGRTLLFCGILDGYSNRDAMRYFFDAIWPRLVLRQSDTNIYIVGRTPPEWLRKIGARDQRVHVTGFVPDVRPYFSKATACVCPVRDGGGTRLKILDSLAMGVPVVATSFAASGLSLNHGEHLLLADTPDAFADSIERVLSNASLRESLSAAGLEIVERVYSWDAIGRSLLDAYEKARNLKRSD